MQPQTLPPTSEAAKYHSLRMYLQVHEWKGCEDELLPTDWGWQKCDEGFVPLQSSIAPALENMLLVIRYTAVVAIFGFSKWRRCSMSVNVNIDIRILHVITFPKMYRLSNRPRF